jgi:phospholipase C
VTDWRPEFNRRRFLRGSAGVAAGMSLAGVPGLRHALAAGHGARRPDSLPDPLRSAGTPDSSMPFDHIVVVMMENHSFDNYFGMLSRHGQPKADGFLFDEHGKPADRQPFKDGWVAPFRAPSMCQPGGVTQAWGASHRQINGGRMNGFVGTSESSMMYWDADQLPFYYSMAKTFTVGNRWFCSTPCQTYPNRRFLMAGTANGLISTDTNSVFDPLPATGTIFDRMNSHGITWKNYFTDLPQTAIMARDVTKNIGKVLPMAQFYIDAALGSLPSVSFVDPEFGLFSDIIDGLKAAGTAIPQLAPLINDLKSINGDEENPSNVEHGETFVWQVVNAVMNSPAWERTLVVYTYDEHGGYYDHVPPPKAIAPDAVKPRLGPKDPAGDYTLLGPRVPTVVVSPYSKPNGVTNVVHDHTSVYATIAAKWNLPACTFRDANATTMMDFLDTTKMSFREPPKLAGHGNSLQAIATCDSNVPKLVVQHGGQTTASRAQPFKKPKKHKRKKKKHKTT